MKAVLIIVVFHMAEIMQFGPYPIDDCTEAAEKVMEQVDDETLLAFCVPLAQDAPTDW